MSQRSIGMRCFRADSTPGEVRKAAALLLVHVTKGTACAITGQHHGGGMGTGAALGAPRGAAAAGMAGRHHDHHRGVDERGMGGERGMGMGNERGMGVERGMEKERGMGNTGMVSTPQRLLCLKEFAAVALAMCL